MPILAVLHKHIIEEITIRNETMEPGHAPFQLKPEIRFQVFPPLFLQTFLQHNMSRLQMPNLL